MTQIHDRWLLVSGLVLISAAMVGNAMTEPDWPTQMGPWHRSMMGGHAMMGGPQSSETQSPIRGALEVEITATDFAFSPREIALTAGEPVNLTLINEGSLSHDLVVADLGVQAEARPGRSSTVGFTPTQAGTYSFICTYSGHADAGMRGTLRLVEP